MFVEEEDPLMVPGPFNKHPAPGRLRCPLPATLGIETAKIKRFHVHAKLESLPFK